MPKVQPTRSIGRSQKGRWLVTDLGFPKENSEQAARFDNLPLFDRSLAKAVTRPRWAVYVLTALIAGLAWLWLLLVTAGLDAGSGGTDLGPAAPYVLKLTANFDPDTGQDNWIGWLVRACIPQSPGSIDLSVFLVAFTMWSAMSIAMMLPSATPMLRTYADIADVARGQGKQVVSIVVLFAGYLAIWLAFAVVAATLQFALLVLGQARDAVTPLQGVIGGSLLAFAGLYQFSALKHACLEKCRNPFSTLFGRWSDRPVPVFKLGIELGLFCLGCCWALMLVMFVVGTMNLVWMAFFTLFAVLEKSGRGKVTSRVSGGILIAWGGILLFLSVFGATAP